MAVKLEKYKRVDPASSTSEQISRPSPHLVVAKLLDQIALSPSSGISSQTPLQTLLNSGKVGSLREGILSLDPNLKKRLFSQFSSDTINRFIAQSEEIHPRLFGERLFALGMEQLKEGRSDYAAAVLNSLSPANASETLREKSRAALNLIHSTGSWNDQVEHFGTRFFSNSLGPQFILPMTFASFFGKAAGTFALGRVVMNQGFAKWLPSMLTHSLGGRLVAGGVSLAVESPAFIATNLAMRKWMKEPLPANLEQGVKESLSFTSTLGVMKLMNFAGNRLFLSLHRFNELGIPTQLSRLQRVSQIAIPQASMFVGMAASHKMEQFVQLRPEVSGLSTLLGTTNSLVTLGLGGRVGGWLAGRKIAELQMRWGVQDRIYSRLLETNSAPSVQPLAKFPTQKISKTKFNLAKLSPAAFLGAGLAAFLSSGAAGNGEPSLGWLLLGVPFLGAAIREGGIRNRGDIKDYQPTFLAQLREQSDPVLLVDKVEEVFGRSVLLQKLSNTIDLTLTSEKSEIFKDRVIASLAGKFSDKNFGLVIEGINSSRASAFEKIRAISSLALTIQSDAKMGSLLDWSVIIYGLIFSHSQGMFFDAAIVDLALQAYSQAVSKVEFNFEPFVYALRQTPGPAFVKGHWIKHLAKAAYSFEPQYRDSFDFTPFINGILYTAAEPLAKIWTISHLASDILREAPPQRYIDLEAFSQGIKRAGAKPEESKEAIAAIKDGYLLK